MPQFKSSSVSDNTHTNGITKTNPLLDIRDGNTPDPAPSSTRLKAPDPRQDYVSFPVWGKNADGTCRCGDANCRAPGKHPKKVAGFANLTESKPVLEGDNTGRPTGEMHGIFVLDTDVKADINGEESLREQGIEPPNTFTVRTASGGLHRYYKHPGYRIRTDANILGAHSGVDVRGDGGNGYVRCPPTPGFTVIDDSPIADASPELLELVRYKEREPIAVGERVERTGEAFEESIPYVVKYLKETPTGVGQGFSDKQKLKVMREVVCGWLWPVDKAVEYVDKYWNTPQKCAGGKTFPLHELERVADNALSYPYEDPCKTDEEQAAFVAQMRAHAQPKEDPTLAKLKKAAEAAEEKEKEYLPFDEFTISDRDVKR